MKPMELAGTVTSLATREADQIFVESWGFGPHSVPTSLALVISFILFLPVACLSIQAQPQSDGPKRYVYVLPEDFHGWACVDFNVADAVPLPREQDALIIQVRQGQVLRSSDKAIELKSEALVQSSDRGLPLPRDRAIRRHVGMVDPANPVRRECSFIGTVDDAAAARDPDRPPLEVPVSQGERQALIALYEASDGGHWHDHAGWLGPPGTECQWHGIRCSYDGTWLAKVIEIQLSENNLVGTVPEQLGQLVHLSSLAVFGNRLSGRVPKQLIQRWLAGSLAISAEASLLTDVSEIDFDSSATSLLCDYHHRVLLQADGRVLLLAKRCRNGTPDDRETYCEVKEGHIEAGDFARLGWLIENNGFYNLERDYSLDITDSSLDRTRVLRAGRSYEVTNYATPGPQELWVIQHAIQGMALSAEWLKNTTQPECPKWNDVLPDQSTLSNK